MCLHVSGLHVSAVSVLARVVACARVNPTRTLHALASVSLLARVGFTLALSLARARALSLALSRSRSRSLSVSLSPPSPLYLSFSSLIRWLALGRLLCNCSVTVRDCTGRYLCISATHRGTRSATTCRRAQVTSLCCW